MQPILQVALVIAGGLALFAVLAFFERRRLEGPTKSIVVVDRGSYRRAEKRIQTALDNGERLRAHAGMVAVRLWLRREVRTGPARRRRKYAHDLEQWELRARQAGFAGIVRH